MIPSPSDDNADILPRRRKPPVKIARIFSDEEWFAAVEAIHPGVTDRLKTFLGDCEPLDVSWSIAEFMIVRMRICAKPIQIFGVSAQGDVHVPWLIPGQKHNFRSFAERLARAIPDAQVRESEHQWIVDKAGKVKITIAELLDAGDVVFEALAELHAATQHGRRLIPGIEMLGMRAIFERLAAA